MFTDNIHVNYRFPVSTEDAVKKKNPAYKSGHASSLRLIRPKVTTTSGDEFVDPCRNWSDMHKRKE